MLREPLVEAQLVDDGIVLVRFQELVRLVEEPLGVVTAVKTWQLDLTLFADGVGEVGVDRGPVTLLDEFDQASQIFVAEIVLRKFGDFYRWLLNGAGGIGIFVLLFRSNFIL